MRAKVHIYAAAVMVSLHALRMVAAPPAADQTGASSAVLPGNALVLFDGRNLDSWLSQKDRHWEESDGAADWKILKDGALEVIPGAGSLITKQKFGDFKLHF